MDATTTTGQVLDVGSAGRIRVCSAVLGPAWERFPDVPGVWDGLVVPFTLKSDLGFVPEKFVPLNWRTQMYASIAAVARMFAVDDGKRRYAMGAAWGKYGGFISCDDAEMLTAGLAGSIHVPELCPAYAAWRRAGGTFEDYLAAVATYMTEVAVALRMHAPRATLLAYGMVGASWVTLTSAANPNPLNMRQWLRLAGHPRLLEIAAAWHQGAGGGLTHGLGWDDSMPIAVFEDALTKISLVVPEHAPPPAYLRLRDDARGGAWADPNVLAERILVLERAGYSYAMLWETLRTEADAVRAGVVASEAMASLERLRARVGGA
ncbi:MAG: hypothetical protein WAZ94_13355 [Phycisphaerales bacterium]